ncbi:MAG: AAA family ATPase [Gammaproteobacteria bacterium]|jgi:capsular exopolysaccharide synthesis family protein
MERIKQAVEKARENRDMLREVVPHELDIASTIKLDNETRQSGPGQVQYTKTRTVPIDERVFKKNRIIANSDDGSPVSNAYKMLRTRLLQQIKKNQWNTIGITSPGIGEGKTLTAVNLALSLAVEGNHTVLLADFDLRYPSVASKFDYEPEYDLSHYLFEGVPLSDVLFNPSIERLVVLPGGRRIPNSSETLVSAEVSQLVQDIKSRYASRIIIFDLPPLLATDDVLAFSPLLDAALLVVEDGKTRQEELSRSLEMLQSVEVAGVVLNKTNEKLDSY